MIRSRWKPIICYYFKKFINFFKIKKPKKIIRPINLIALDDLLGFSFESRNSIILKSHVGKVFSVHNGKEFINIKVKKIMIGEKFGSFSYTKKRGGKIHAYFLKKLNNVKRLF